MEIERDRIARRTPGHVECACGRRRVAAGWIDPRDSARETRDVYLGVPNFPVTATKLPSADEGDLAGTRPPRRATDNAPISDRRHRRCVRACWDPRRTAVHIHRLQR